MPKVLTTRQLTYSTVTAGTELHFPDAIAETARLFPQFQSRYLHQVGYLARKLLWFQYLQGQHGITYHNGAYDQRLTKKRNHYRKTTYRLRRDRQAVAIKSYPMNLWEHGFTRFGTRIPGYHILKKLGTEVEGSKLQHWSQRYLFEPIEKEYG